MAGGGADVEATADDTGTVIALVGVGVGVDTGGTVEEGGTAGVETTGEDGGESGNGPTGDSLTGITGEVGGSSRGCGST